MNYKKPVAVFTLIFLFLFFNAVGLCGENGKITLEQWTKVIKNDNKQDNSFNRSDLQNILDTEWQEFSRDKTNFGGGIAIQIIAPSGNYFMSSGMGKDMDNSHRFRVASVTKTFTAASIMLLHKRGQLNINHRLSEKIPGKTIPYFPYNIHRREDITIRMVLMHRAGIFDLTNTDIQSNAASRDRKYVHKNYIEETMAMDKKYLFTFHDLFSVIEGDKQVGFDPPDSKFEYSDTGYTVLGYIIEQVSGKKYEEFVRDEFLIPNGLLNTSFPDRKYQPDMTLPPPFTRGYSWDGNTLKDVTEDNMSAFVGNGNMISTPLDLAIWVKKLMTGQTALDMCTVEMMKAGSSRELGKDMTYGLGIEYFPQAGYGHGGDHEGYTTFMFYKPEQNIAYVAFMNIWDQSKTIDSYAAQKKFLSNTVSKVFARMGL